MELLNNLPKERSNKFGVISVFVLLNLVTLNDLITLFYEYYENPIYSFVILSFGIFVLINIYGNMYRAITTNTSIFSNQLPRIQLDGWKFCSICEQYTPPRAYHCLTCDRCILKRHNHCLFLGKCAGYKNFRFYILFVFYVWLGTLISNIINFDFYKNALFNINLKSLLMTFVPWFAWLFGMVTLKDFFLMFTNTMTVILFFIMFFYFLINFNMAINGQTWYERSKKFQTNSKRMDNFVEVFGLNWKCALVWPFASLKLPSDGTSSMITNEANTFMNLKNV